MWDFSPSSSKRHRVQVIRARALLSCLCLSIGLLIALSTLSFPVYADSSDLTVDSIWLESASAPGVPVAGTDLALDESFSIVAGIKNLGQEAANGYYLDVYYDNDYGRGGPDNITAGEVQEWYVGPLTATAGTHTTQWVVDPDNQIAELDEQNNVKQYVFTVGSSEPQTTTESTATVSVTVIQNPTSFSYGTTTTTVTAYSTSTSTIPIVTTIALVPLTVASTVQDTELLTSTLTTTVTSYTGTSTSTIPTVTTIALIPSTTALTVQNTQYVTSVLTTTVTSYTGTQALTSTVVVPTTVTLAPLAATSSVQARQVQTSTRTTTETKYTTVTITSYTGTLTSTSTRVVYTTATSLASAGASSPLAYLGFISLLALTLGGGMAEIRWVVPKVRSWAERRCSSS